MGGRPRGTARAQPTGTVHCACLLPSSHLLTCTPPRVLACDSIRLVMQHPGSAVHASASGCEPQISAGHYIRACAFCMRGHLGAEPERNHSISSAGGAGQRTGGEAGAAIGEESSRVGRQLPCGTACRTGGRAGGVTHRGGQTGRWERKRRACCAGMTAPGQPLQTPAAADACAATLIAAAQALETYGHIDESWRVGEVQTHGRSERRQGRARGTAVAVRERAALAAGVAAGRTRSAKAGTLHG